MQKGEKPSHPFPTGFSPHSDFEAVGIIQIRLGFFVFMSLLSSSPDFAQLQENNSKAFLWNLRLWLRYTKRLSPLTSAHTTRRLVFAIALGTYLYYYGATIPFGSALSSPNIP